jgi:chromosome segregation ATPase
MPRVTVSLADSILHKVDDEANKSGISRSEYVAQAIESFVTGSNQASITLHNLELELNKSQTEVMQLKRMISKFENQIAENDKSKESKASEVMQIQEKLNQAYADGNQAREEVAKYEMAIKLKDQHISFLEATVHQALEKIMPALPPGQEEARAKSWWQFWRRE